MSDPLSFERLTRTPAGVTLGPVAAIAEGAARNYVLEIGGRRFHGFVVHREGAVFGYVDSCPHTGMPLAQHLDDYLTEDGSLIECDWHGALFRIEDGLCLGGPCVGAHLDEWPVEIRDGMIVTR